jgi:hypothetical protein
VRGGSAIPAEDSDIVRGLRAFGADDAFLAEWREAQRAQPLDVWDDNEQALLVFLESSTQWRYAGMEGARVGLDYAGVRSVIALLGVPETPALFGDLRDMEHEALQQLKARKS